MSLWLLFISNSRLRHKSYLSKRGFLEIRSTSVLKDRVPFEGIYRRSSTSRTRTDQVFIMAYTAFTLGGLWIQRSVRTEIRTAVDKIGCSLMEPIFNVHFWKWKKRSYCWQNPLYRWPTPVDNYEYRVYPNRTCITRYRKFCDPCWWCYRCRTAWSCSTDFMMFFTICSA